MSLSRVNAGHVAGQAVLIDDQRRKNCFEVSGRETATFYFFRSAGSRERGADRSVRGGKWRAMHWQSSWCAGMTCLSRSSNQTNETDQRHQTDQILAARGEMVPAASALFVMRLSG
jgi:hypothetical protein